VFHLGVGFVFFTSVGFDVCGINFNTQDLENLNNCYERKGEVNKFKVDSDFERLTIQILKRAQSKPRKQDP